MHYYFSSALNWLGFGKIFLNFQIKEADFLLKNSMYFYKRRSLKQTEGGENNSCPVISLSQEKYRKCFFFFSLFKNANVFLNNLSQGFKTSLLRFT